MIWLLFLLAPLLSVSSTGTHRKTKKERQFADVQEIGSKSIKCVIEDQAFSYDFTPPHSPLSRQQVVSLSQPSSVSRVELTDRGGGGDGAK